MRFAETQLALNSPMHLTAPIIEVTRQDHRRIRWDMLGNTRRNAGHLRGTGETTEIQMGTQQMDRSRKTVRLDHGVDDAPPLERGNSQINIFYLFQRPSTQDRIAMMAEIIDRIAAIGVMLPHLIGEIFRLRFIVEIRSRLAVTSMGTLDFLQKDHVGFTGAQGVAHAGQFEPAITG